MFQDYADEISNPEARKEQEAYISQLEKEGKVPEGKDAIHPKPGFVVKTHKLSSRSLLQQQQQAAPEKTQIEKEKIFINIVTSDKIARPSSQQTHQGTSWSVPCSTGHVRMEKDKCK